MSVYAARNRFVREFTFIIETIGSDLTCFNFRLLCWNDIFDNLCWIFRDTAHVLLTLSALDHTSDRNARWV